MTLAEFAAHYPIPNAAERECIEKSSSPLWTKLFLLRYLAPDHIGRFGPSTDGLEFYGTLCQPEEFHLLYYTARDAAKISAPCQPSTWYHECFADTDFYKPVELDP